VIVDAYHADETHGLAVDADWLADVACQNAIDTGDEREYPAWYGCVHLRASAEAGEGSARLLRCLVTAAGVASLLTSRASRP